MKHTPITDSTKRAVYLKWLSGNFTLKEIATHYKISEHSISVIISQKLNNKKIKK